jgi:hypothetical protein
LTSYEDVRLTCRRCGTPFVFTAEQQRHWYDDLGLIEARKPPSLCGPCGRDRRTARTLQNRLTRAVLTARRRPDDPAAHLAVAAATAALVAHTGRGTAARGVAAARRARALDPALHEALYREAACHDAAGRTAPAAAAYRRFAEAAGTTRRLRRLVGHATDRAWALTGR